ncbi:MAG: preprotein translocase subunit SecG [Planctomycetota bacterium]|nr:preprotein translocase subunit SecG [Planctomycetota bacterium]MDA1105623.1 preprotein translocase subunit SecG [Planctomycetota bacterium]
MDWLFGILLVGFIIVSIAMVLIILVQRPQGGGLAAAFGGSSGGGTDTAFGGRTGDVLTVTTVGAFTLYLLIAIGLNIVSNVRIEEANAAQVAPGQGTSAVDGENTDTPATGPAGIEVQDNSAVLPSDALATGPADVEIVVIPAAGESAAAPASTPEATAPTAEASAPATAPAPAPVPEPAPAPGI